MILEVKNLRREFGDLVAVDDISFRLEEGDIFGFIGPNGAGKTTTIRMLATLLEPTSGQAVLKGVSIFDEPEKVRPILGYMPDNYGFYEDLLVWEYLDFYAGAYRLPPHKRQKVIQDVLYLTDLGVKREAVVKTLSRGMKQRLYLAKCLLHDPAFFLLDEPASGLDPRARIEFRGLIKELSKMGKTVFISSHILTELSDICNKVGVIEKGEILACGQIDDIYEELKSKMQIKIKFRGELSNLQNDLENLPDIQNVLIENQRAIFDYMGDPNQTDAVLSYLVDKRYRICHFEESAGNLEDVFMKITKGDVS